MCIDNTWEKLLSILDNILPEYGSLMIKTGADGKSLT